MTNFLQLHLLTFLPPSNVNRDDTGRPKTAVVGGETRLRISSQAIKRAMRQSDAFALKLAGRLGSRTQRFGTEIAFHLAGRGVDEERAAAVAREVIAIFGKPKPADDDDPLYTEQLAFLSPAEKAAALALAEARADGTVDAIDARKSAPAVLKSADTAADIAMFGRMFADNPDFNREAAVQVAHAITTHRVAVEDDFYTAVDDLKRPAEDAGAGFVGEAGFGSGVFYLYVCIDTGLLVRNLAGELDLARDSVEALVTAAATVAPSGKQASFASRVRASYLLAEAGEDQPRTLASAFARGVRGPEILSESVRRLKETRDRFAAAYGTNIPSIEMDVESGVGNLADVVAFARGFGA